MNKEIDKFGLRELIQNDFNNANSDPVILDLYKHGNLIISNVINSDTGNSDNKVATGNLINTTSVITNGSKSIDEHLEQLLRLVLPGRVVNELLIISFVDKILHTHYTQGLVSILKPMELKLYAEITCQLLALHITLHPNAGEKVCLMYSVYNVIRHSGPSSVTEQCNLL